LMIVRTLSKPEYSLFAIANSMQTTVNVLADLGITIGVRSIGGRVWNDRERFGQLLNTALLLRKSFALVSIGICLPLAIWMLRKNGADWQATILLCCLIVAGILPLLKSSILRAVPDLHGEYRRIQKLDLGNAILRVLAIGILALSRMNAVLVASIAVVVNWITMLCFTRWARDHADFNASINADDRRELWRLSIRILPNNIFFCIQGQVTLLILTLAGNPTGIADVTALGRLSALLTVFSLAFNSVLTPRFARCQNLKRLPRLYLGLIAGTALIIAPVALAGWFMPGPLLWLLGTGYSGLKGECGWAVSTACVVQLVTALHQLNSARAWIRITTIMHAPLTIAAQVLVLALLDVSNLHGVLVFGFLTSLTTLPTLIADAYIGLRDQRKLVNQLPT